MLLFYRYAKHTISYDKSDDIDSRSCSASQSNKLRAQALLSLFPHIYSFLLNPIPVWFPDYLSTFPRPFENTKTIAYKLIFFRLAFGLILYFQ